MIRAVRGWLGSLDDCDPPLVLSVLLLCCCGTLVVFAAGSYQLDAAGKAAIDGRYLAKHLLRLGLGLCALILLARWDYRLFARPRLRNPLLAAGIVLVAIPVVTGGGAINRWMHLFGLFPVQPLELAKLAVVIHLAGRLAHPGGSALTGRRGLGVTLGVGPGLLMLALALQPNYGNVLVIGAATLVLLFAAGISARLLAAGLAFLASGAVVGTFVVAKLNYRVGAWLHGLLEDDYVYQVKQSLIGLGAGGWFGLGLGNGHNKFAFLPESHTDFVFSILGEELGLFGTLLAVSLFTLFAWRGLGIAARAAEPFGRLLALGLTSLIFTYAAINMAMATGLFPVAGVPLPFVSYGGSALVTNLAAVGILLNIDRQGRAHREWRRRWARA
jgi:cell division protein FtsW